MSYIDPADVKSPKAHWYLFEVVLDKGPDEYAYAIGEWDSERRIGFRWNGNDESPLGNPQSRGIPTWTMLDPALHRAVIELLEPSKQAVARGFFGFQE